MEFNVVNKIYIVFVITSLIVLQARNIGFCECPKSDAEIAETDIDHLKTWTDLYASFKRYSACDDGAIAEGYSDFTVQTLAHHWDQLKDLIHLTSSDRQFKNFILTHIDATADAGDIMQVLLNARNHCPTGASGMCSEIEHATVRAAQDLESVKKK